MHQSGSHLEAIFLSLCQSFIDQVEPASTPWRMGNSHSSQLAKDNSPEKGEALSYYQLTLTAQKKGILAHAHMCECTDVCMYTCVHTYTHAHCAQTHPYRQKTKGIHIKLVRWLLLGTGPRLRGVVKVGFGFYICFSSIITICYITYLIRK